MAIDIIEIESCKSLYERFLLIVINLRFVILQKQYHNNIFL